MTGLTAGPRAPRYELERRLATGGMGEVWVATDSVLGRQVAVKVLKPEYADEPLFRRRFETEARHAAALDHPNVASVFDFGELPAPDASDAARPFLVMELVPGEPLSALLRGGEPMPSETAADLIRQAADAVAAAHALDIVHRDIKPANLLVTPDGTVKITDFGIARAVDGAALTATGQIVGTPQYLSPEQAEGKPATKASDIYALGVVLYEALAGRRPFDGGTPVTIALQHLREAPPRLPDAVPPRLREAVDRAMAKDPAARFGSARDLAAALRGGPVEPATTVTPAGVRNGPPAVPSSRMAGAGAAGAAAAAAGLDDGDHTRVLAAPPPAPRRRGRRVLPSWLPWAATALAVLLVLGTAAVLATRSSDTAGPATAPRTPAASPRVRASRKPRPSPTPQGVLVRGADYVGMRTDEARRILEGKGLRVQETRIANPGGYQKDTVAAVRPEGLLSPGSTVWLVAWDGPRPQDQQGWQHGPGRDHGHGHWHGSKRQH
jgi:serine/threonine-protein kinase